MTSCYPRWRREGNLKVKIGDTQTPFCMTLVAGLSTEIWNKAVLPTIKRPFALRVEIRLNSVQTGLFFVVQLTFTNSFYLLQLNTFRWKTRFNSLSTDFPHLFERITIDHINNAVYLPLLLDGPISIASFMLIDSSFAARLKSFNCPNRLSKCYLVRLLNIIATKINLLIYQKERKGNWKFAKYTSW